MKCEKCGTEFIGNMKFCKTCGAEAKKQKENTDVNNFPKEDNCKNKKLFKTLAYVFVIMFIVSCVAAFYFLQEYLSFESARAMNGTVNIAELKERVDEIELEIDSFQSIENHIGRIYSDVSEITASKVSSTLPKLEQLEELSNSIKNKFDLNAKEMEKIGVSGWEETGGNIYDWSNHEIETLRAWYDNVAQYTSGSPNKSALAVQAQKDISANYLRITELVRETPYNELNSMETIYKNQVMLIKEIKQYLIVSIALAVVFIVLATVFFYKISVIKKRENSMRVDVD